MSNSFTIKIEGYDRLQQVLKDLPKKKLQQVEDAFETAAVNINRNQKRLAPTDFGAGGGLLGAITFKKNPGIEYEMTAQRFYAAYLEFGTKNRVKIPAELQEVASQFKGKATAGQSGQDFYDNILAWVKRKGITGVYSVKTRRRLKRQDDNIEDEQVAFAIYLSILRHGIRPQPFFFAPYFNERPKLIKEIKEILVA